MSLSPPRLHFRLFAQIRRLLTILRWRSFDVSSPEGRSQERHRRIALTALSGMGARGISLLTSFITVPLTLNYLGEERYGVWLVMSSIITLLSFADLGIANGLFTIVAQAEGKQDRDWAKRHVSSAFFMFLAIASVLGLIYAAVGPWINWSKIFNISAVHAPEVGPAMSMWIGCFLISLPLGIVERIRVGLQEGFANSLYAMLGSLLSLGAVLLAIHHKANLPWLVLALAGVPLLCSLLNGIILFTIQHRWIRPAMQWIDIGAMRRLIGMGSLYFVLQVAGTVAFAADNLIVTQLFGPAVVPQLAVPARLFGMVSLLLSFGLTPLWPAYSEAIARRDTAWVKRTLKRSLIFCGGFSAVLSGVLIFSADEIIVWWVGPTIQPTFGLLLALGLWTFLSVLGICVAMFLNGINAIRFQAVSAVFMAVGAITAKLWLVDILELPAVIWGTIISYIVFTVIPTIVYLPRLSKSLATESQPA